MYKKVIIIFISFFLLFLKISSSVYAEENGQFRFIVMGCMHIGVCDFQDYELAVEKMKQYNPDFVLFLGSMVDTVGERSDKEGYRYSTLRAEDIFY